MSPHEQIQASKWVSAAHYLPRTNHLPVEVDEGQAPPYRIMVTCQGDWRKVQRWRKVSLTKHEIKGLSQHNLATSETN